MKLYTNPFEAMSAVNNILTGRGLDLFEGDWAKEILQYTCQRRYKNGDIYFNVMLQLTEKGFNIVKEKLGRVDYTFGSYSMPGDPYVRITITIDSVLQILTLVEENSVDAIMAL